MYTNINRDYEVGKYLINKNNGHVGRIEKITGEDKNRIFRLLTDLYTGNIDSIIELGYDEIYSNWESYTGFIPPMNIDMGKLHKVHLIDNNEIEKIRIHIDGEIGTLIHCFDVVFADFTKYDINEIENIKKEQQKSKKLMKLIAK